jgi:hypothetical protein
VRGRGSLSSITLTRRTADASRLSSQIKSELPGKEKEIKKEGEALFSQAGTKFDQAVSTFWRDAHLDTHST